MILVAGGTGHLGSELVPVLVASGRRVRVLTRDPARPTPVMQDGVELAQGDLRDGHSLDSVMGGVDAVVSAATGFGPGGSGPRAIDYQGNLNLIRAAEAAAVRHFVLLSMHAAAADHPMELLRMKHLAEQGLRASRLEWTIIRPTVFMELWAGLVGRPILKSGKVTVFGRGDNPINFISVLDLARFVELALADARLRGQELEVGGPENLTLNQVVDVVGTVFKKAPTVRHIPLPAMRLFALLMGPLKPDLAGMIQAGIVMDTMDMRFEASELSRRYPAIPLTRLEVVARRSFGRADRSRISPSAAS